MLNLFKQKKTVKKIEAAIPAESKQLSAMTPEMLEKPAPQATQPGSHDKATTMIAGGCELKGNIIATGNVHVHGSVIGNITVVDGTIRLMRSGKIQGDLQAAAIVLDGAVTGRCMAESIEILEHGKLNGVVRASCFSIKHGGIFIGQSEYSEPKRQASGNVLSTESLPLVTVPAANAAESGLGTGDEKAAG